jgi:2-oxoglutarate/2-oxoacid ferredoxin oxidoreductase subunit beta
MTSIAKPPVRHPGLPKNAIGLTVRDYEGVMSTLCAGCGHDSVTAAITQAFFELGVEPHRVAKLSGIGCSSKTPAYFLKQAHGFNSVHGRMPAVATGVNAANRDLTLIGISGDGDSLSIGLGQLSHAIRRNVDMLYVLENNGVYGLTKGQFSASADLGSKAKRGEANAQQPIDPVLLALTLGATFVARSFSGDKAQLVPILKAGLAHKGFALVDVISPCVTFNDHEGSTKSYSYVKDHEEPLGDISFVPFFEDINVEYDAGTTTTVTLHNGSRILLSKLAEDYHPTDKMSALRLLHETAARGEYATGIIYVEPDKQDFVELLGIVDEPLATLPESKTRPGKAALDEIMESFR